MAQEINKKVREGIMNSKGSNCGERYGTVKTIN